MNYRPFLIIALVWFLLGLCVSLERREARRGIRALRASAVPSGEPDRGDPSA